MENQKADPRLVADIIHHFNEKKRLTIRNYVHRSSEKDEKAFDTAANLCTRYELDPGTYVQLIYDRFGVKPAYFAPMCLQGTKVVHFLEDRKKENTGYIIEETNASLTPEKIWNQQTSLAMIYINNGESTASVLMNSSLKFFAWFRILSTPDRYEPVIAKYKHIARKELTTSIKEYAKSAGLDIDRILG